MLRIGGPGGELRAEHVLQAARFQWRLAWQRRRLLRTLLLHLFPIALAALGAILKWSGVITVLGSDILSNFLVFVYLQILLVLVALLFGTGLVTSDAEARTLPYLLVRPLSRGSLLVGKFLGAWLVASLLLCASMLVSALLLLGSDGFVDAGAWVGRIPRFGIPLVLGALAYGALFTFVGLVFPRPAIVGLFLAFGWENIIQFLPGWIKSLTVRHHLAALVPRQSVPAEVLALLDPPGMFAGLVWLVGSAALFLGLSMGLFARRDFV